MNVTTEHLTKLIESAFSQCVHRKPFNALDHNNMLDLARLGRILRLGVMHTQERVCYEIIDQVQAMDRNLMPEAYEAEEDKVIDAWEINLTKSVSFEGHDVELQTRHGLADPESNLYARRISQNLVEIIKRAGRMQAMGIILPYKAGSVEGIKLQAVISKYDLENRFKFQIPARCVKKCELAVQPV